MPKQLLREPHILAHELRTPLSVLAGWYSLARDGDISKSGTPEQWGRAMVACQAAIDRLNFVISEACNEASSLRWPSEGKAADQRSLQLFEEATKAIARSRELFARLERSEVLERRRQANRANQARAAT